MIPYLMILASELQWLLRIWTELQQWSLLERYDHGCPGHKLRLLWADLLGRGSGAARDWHLRLLQ